MYRGVTALQFPPFLLPLIFINITGHCSDASTSTQPLFGHLLEFSASVIGTVFSCYAIGTFARAGMPGLSRRYSAWPIFSPQRLYAATTPVSRRLLRGLEFPDHGRSFARGSH